MKVELKIWRYDASTGERALRPYEVDVLRRGDAARHARRREGPVDGSLAYRKSCRMMICGSCGMRVDGGAVLACKTRIADVARDGHVPVISAMGNLPIVKDLVVDMDPFWQKMRAIQPYLEPRLDRTAEKENVVSQERMDVVHKESLCINCGCCVSECNSMESDPDFLGPAALAKGFRFVGDPRDGATIERLERYSEAHGIWDCTRCYFCNERCPKGVDPRDAIAKLGAEAMKAGIDRDMGARHAKWFVTSAKTTGWLRETELVPKTQGVVKAIKEIKFAMSLLPKGKVPPPFPPHVAADVGESRALFDLVKEQGRDGAAGIVQGEKALHAPRPPRRDDRGRPDPPVRRPTLVREALSPRRGAPRVTGRVKQVAYYKGRRVAAVSSSRLRMASVRSDCRVSLRVLMAPLCWVAGSTAVRWLVPWLAPARIAQCRQRSVAP